MFILLIVFSTVLIVFCHREFFQFSAQIYIKSRMSYRQKVHQFKIKSEFSKRPSSPDPLRRLRQWQFLEDSSIRSFVFSNSISENCTTKNCKTKKNCTTVSGHPAHARPDQMKTNKASPFLILTATPLPLNLIVPDQKKKQNDCKAKM